MSEKVVTHRAMSNAISGRGERNNWRPRTLTALLDLPFRRKIPRQARSEADGKGELSRGFGQSCDLHQLRRIGNRSRTLEAVKLERLDTVRFRLDGRRGRRITVGEVDDTGILIKD